MKILQHAFQVANRVVADPRFALAVRVSSVAAVLFLPAVAHAYLGESIVLWLRGSVVAPLCLFALIGAAAVILWRPQHAVLVLGVLVTALFIMWVMSNGAQIMQKLEAAGQQG